MGKVASLARSSTCRTILLVVLLACALLTASGCGQSQQVDASNSQSQESYELSGSHKIIFDTDTAADDAVALALAAKSPNIEIEGVTVLAGNVSLEQGCKNALMTLEVAGKGSVPVYAGSATKLSGEEIVPHSVFGNDGMGDQGLVHPVGTPAGQDGVDFIIQAVKSHPGEIEIVATGPLTNVAKAIQKDPDTMKQVKRIWSMGTGGTSYLGNASPVAEFNVAQDTAAYKCVMEAGIPVTVVGNDVCSMSGVKWNEADLSTLAQAGSCGAYLSKALGSYASQYSDAQGYASVCDPVMVAALTWSDFVTGMSKCHATVVTDSGSPAFGEVIFCVEGEKYDFVGTLDKYNVEVVKSLNSAPYISNLCQLIK